MPVAGKRQDAHRSSTMFPREMAALWALHHSALPQHPQLKEDKKLQLVWGQRPIFQLLYTVVQINQIIPQEKAQRLSTLLYPEILLWFRLSAAWGSTSPIPGCMAVTPPLQTGLVGKGGQGGQEGALWELQLPSQPV